MKLTKEQVLGIVRHGLTFIGGLLITRGMLDQNTLSELIGASSTLVGIVWSIINKKQG